MEKLFVHLIRRSDEYFELAGLSEDKRLWFSLPDEHKNLYEHKVLSSKTTIKSAIAAIKPINGFRKIGIKLDEDLKKEYFDEDGNLSYKNYPLQESVVFFDVGWTAVRKAYTYKYLGGSLIDYALTKENLCLEVESDSTMSSRINLIVMGLPSQVQDELDREDINTIKKLYNELRKLDGQYNKRSKENKPFDNRSDNKYDPIIQKLPSAIKLIQSQGFIGETHRVVTEDGYILSLHRIPYQDRTKKYKGPVLIHHGLLGSSDLWLLRSREDDLAYLLADQGYDVWLGNARGNTHSRKHISLKTKDPKFWKFGFHEFGYYDLPASIDYILNKTNEKQLFYIGHSMGTLMTYILGSTRPEYNDKFRISINLSPVYFLKVRNQMQATMVEGMNSFQQTLERRGIFEAFPSSEVNLKIIRMICEAGFSIEEICLETTARFLGWDPKQTPLHFIPHLLKHFPMGTSTQTLAHFGQIIRDARGLKPFDYGTEKNLKLYGDVKPPLYDLSKVTLPTAMYYSRGDFIVNTKDVRQIAKLLPNLVGVYEVPKKSFNHNDFLWAKDAKELVYNDLIKLINNF
ncbi:lipase 3-like [Chrysoperla carnea]|uniref:lipase 3-like n=1 Tax=Chrysoperla carnea TaxID=189513 RepID=UPI001D086B61|nr:lipase 3-like [Chrysoperla carnea]